MELEIVPLEWSAVLTGVGAGKYDMAVAGMAYTPERAETMAMSKVYKPGGDQGLLVPADKVDEYTSLADFAGKKVGFQSGTVQEQNVLTQLPDSEPVTFDIIQNAVLALDRACMTSGWRKPRPRPKIWACKIRPPGGELHCFHL